MYIETQTSHEFQVDNEPWTHIIQDDFLNASSFQLMKHLTTKFQSGEQILANQAFVSKSSGEVSQSSEIFSNEEVINIFNTYEPKLLSQLKYLAPKKLKYYDYFELSLVKTPRNQEYPIHNDIGRKLLSVVIFISPEKNEGTLLYKKGSKEIFKQIEWKPNRSFAFSRLENITSHSYFANDESDRFTLIINLITSKPLRAIFSEKQLISKFVAIKFLIKRYKNIILSFLSKLKKKE